MSNGGFSDRDPPGDQPIDSGAIRRAIPPELLGRAEIAPGGRFETGSFASFELTYTAGVYGIDHSGSLRVCFRFASDQGDPQFDDPMGANYSRSMPPTAPCCSSTGTPRATSGPGTGRSGSRW